MENLKFMFSILKKICLIFIMLIFMEIEYFTAIAYDSSKAQENIVGDNSTEEIGFPSGGTDIYNLVILISFKDEEALTKDEIKNINEVYNGRIGWSVNTFYNAYTYRKGTCTTIIGPYKNNVICEYVDKHDISYYQYDEYSEGLEDNQAEIQKVAMEREYELITNAIEFYKKNLPPDFDISKFDKDNNGKIDNITFIVNGKEDTEWSALLWAHKAKYEDVIYYGTKDGIKYNNEGEYVLKETGKKLDANELEKKQIELQKKYELYIENKKVNNYNMLFDAKKIKEQTSVCIHEFMHIFGYPDDYSYEGKTANNTLRF